MKTQHFIYCLTIVAVLFTACKKDKEQGQEQGIPVTGVTLNKTELMLAPGDTVTLIATVEPDSATNKTVTWTSSKTSVATVNSNGLVTAIGKGDATITVITKDGKTTATCLITVGEDYRAKWVGDWDFEINRHWWSGVGENYTEGDTIYYYLGKISIGNAGNELIIDYIGNISLVMAVDEFGKLFTIKDHPLGYTGNGQFDKNDKVHIERGEGHGHGGGGRDLVNGTKITKGGKSE